MLLDYSEYIEGNRFSGTSGESDSDPKELFYKQRGWCPFCKCNAHIVFSNEKTNFITPGEGTSDMVCAYSCSTCGWWEVDRKNFRDCLDGFNSVSKTLKHSILRSFADNSSKVPVDVLREELKKRPSLLGEMAPVKMEELVQSVFSEFYSCEVYHCGKAGDNGIDLLMINADVPCAIQVKRRKRLDSTEGVSHVREFLGALVDQNIVHGIFVSTADHFSSPAKALAERNVARGVATQFDLVDGTQLLDRLKLVAKPPFEHWRRHI